MKNVAIAIALLSALVVPSSSFAKKSPELEGKLVLSSSALTDGYRTYKVAFLMGDKGAILWNKSGSFKPEDDDDRGSGKDCPVCRIVQRLMSQMLDDCKATQADFCTHEMPLRYRIGSCEQNSITCLAIEFPKDPSRGMAGPHETLYIVAPIRPSEEIAADLGGRCVGSRYVTACKTD